LAEVIQNDVKYDDIRVVKTIKPSCDYLCMVSGQKAFNEMHNILELSSGTYFRLWFF